MWGADIQRSARGGGLTLEYERDSMENLCETEGK